MTEHKHFKQLVRTRMGKTGESYSTARRHVIRQSGPAAAASPAPAHYPGSIPSVTALRALLAHAGLRAPHTKAPYSEAMVLGLSGGIGAGMFSFHYATANHSSFFVAGRHSWHDHVAWALGAAQRLGLKTVVKESSGIKPGEKQLRELVAGGRPVLAWLDASGLPMRGGMYSVAAIHGIDEAAGTALVGDVSDQLIPVPLEQLAQARARTKKDKNRLLALEPAGKTPGLDALVRGGIAACTESLVKGRIKNFTLDAFATWADRLEGSKAADSWDKFFPAGPNLYRGLTGITEYVEYYGTGGGLCRPMFAEFLEEAGEALGDRRLGAIGEHYASLGTEWSALAEAALPDDVPVLRAAKERLAEKAELLASQDQQTAPGVAQCMLMADAVAAKMKDGFPMSDTAVTTLRRDLKRRVTALYQAEIAGVAALRDWL